MTTTPAQPNYPKRIIGAKPYIIAICKREAERALKRMDKADAAIHRSSAERRCVMAEQAEFQFAAPSDLERFNIPPYRTDVRYGHVSRHLRTLWRAGRRDEAAELALVADEVFNEPYWSQRYPAQSAELQKGPIP